MGTPAGPEKPLPGRNPLTGLSGLQPTHSPTSLIEEIESQSPYGAKWFATENTKRRVSVNALALSQSPYGAKWFATRSFGLAERLKEAVAIPLRG